MEPISSITDLPDFPFATYDEFLQAHEQGQALIWVRPAVGTAWKLGGPDDRVMYVFLFGAAWFIAAAFAVFAFRQHNGWLLLGSLASLICFMYATPSPACVGHGCIPGSMFIASLIASPFAGTSALLIGFAAPVSWFLASAGLGVVDGAIREAMVRSEETFLQFYAQGVITNVEKKPNDPTT